MDHRDDPNTPVIPTLSHEQLEAILQNAEWSLRFAELYQDGDPLEQVPLWRVIDRLYDEFACARLPEDRRPGTPDDSWAPQEDLDREIKSNLKLRGDHHVYEGLTYRLCRALGWPGEQVAEYKRDDGSMDFPRLLKAAIEGVERGLQVSPEAAKVVIALDEDARWRYSGRQRKRPRDYELLQLERIGEQWLAMTYENGRLRVARFRAHFDSAPPLALIETGTLEAREFNSMSEAWAASIEELRAARERPVRREEKS